ncbi:hypothetical protein B0H16DRAFT_1732424 [Mycena metata]|uniref:Restriction of telomere capping protein 4 C-terminal domain-containing protein n=1 Tax=Mycena metata TaxID=1033252 RepID=A0AAD7I1P8_9AGAR|nr:hypothetical protein B0H16DRAFT_1732424 [Mycena metata]
MQLLMRASTRRRKTRKSPKKRTRNPKTLKKAEKKRKKICHCTEGCGKLLAPSTRRAHYRTVNNVLWKDSESEDGGSSGDSESDGNDSAEMNVDNSDNNLFQPPDNIRQQSYSVDPLDMDAKDSSDSDDSDDMSSSDFMSGISDFMSNIESDSELDGLGSEIGMDSEEWADFDEEIDHELPISRDEMIAELEEMLGPDEESELWAQRNETLTEQDRDNIRAFRLKMLSNMPRVAFAQMRHAFRHKLEISSHWVMIHRIAILSCIEPMWFHCCPDSCMAYTGAYKDLTKCEYCNEPRFNALGNPRRLFCYLPIIPRLQGFFMNPEKVKQLLYRHKYNHIPGTISDVFDCEHYRTLCTQRVVVDGHKLSHNYFSNPYDIALGFCTDSYLLFDRRRKGPSATPILAEVYSVPPKTRTHLEDLFCCGVISGPKGPKDAHSYLVPLDDEFLRSRMDGLDFFYRTVLRVSQTWFALQAVPLGKLEQPKELSIFGLRSTGPSKSEYVYDHCAWPIRDLIKKYLQNAQSNHKRDLSSEQEAANDDSSEDWSARVRRTSKAIAREEEEEEGGTDAKAELGEEDGWVDDDGAEGEDIVFDGSDEAEGFQLDDADWSVPDPGELTPPAKNNAKENKRPAEAKKKRDASLEKAQAQGWPTSIRFDELSARVLGFKDEILQLASDSDELHKNSVWREFIESINYQVYKFAAAPDSFQNAKKEAYRGGYFGPQGRSIIGATIEHLISTEIPVDQIIETLTSLVDTPQPWDDTDDETKLILETDFVDFILTPHITISLIALELDLPFDEAWTVFQQSDKIGRVLHPILHTASPQENSPSPIKRKELKSPVAKQKKAQQKKPSQKKTAVNSPKPPAAKHYSTRSTKPQLP